MIFSIGLFIRLKGVFNDMMVVLKILLISFIEHGGGGKGERMGTHEGLV